jgi:hypothetical protein
MALDPELSLTHEECRQLLAELFPRGFGGDDVLRELAPAGWAESPLCAVFHPAPEVVEAESQRMLRNLREVFGRTSSSADDEEESGEPSDADASAPAATEPEEEIVPQRVDPQLELRELVGKCLWDLFSDNHEVVAPDGRIAHLGSFRAAGGFLAETLNAELGLDSELAQEREMSRLKNLIGVKPADLVAHLKAQWEQEDKIPREERGYDYMDFYCGTQMVGGRADLTGVYRFIFRRLRAAGCDWRYTFPRLHLVDLRPLGDALKERDESSQFDYDPSAAFAQEAERAEKDAEIAETRAQLDDSYCEAVAAAREGPPPLTVAAYRAEYGEWPEGWPPSVE